MAVELIPNFLQRPTLTFRLQAHLRKTPIVRAMYRRKWNRRGETMLLSYPKAGRTWLRIMIGHAMADHFDLPLQEAIRLDRLSRNRHPMQQHQHVPAIRAKHDDNPQLKTPGELVTTKTEYRDIKIILLIRDLRDLAVSAYLHMGRRDGLFHGDIGAFIRNPRGGVRTMVRFYNVWADNRDMPADFMLLRYEDMHADTAGELRRVLHFAGIRNVADQTIRRAVDFGSFDNMRKLEVDGGLKDTRLRPGDPNDTETYKPRRGIVGGYGDYLGADDGAYVKQCMTELSPFYGYDVRSTSS